MGEKGGDGDAGPRGRSRTGEVMRGGGHEVMREEGVRPRGRSRGEGGQEGGEDRR